MICVTVQISESAITRRVRIGGRLRRDAVLDGLLCFDDLREIPGAIGGIHRDTRSVPVAQIEGSVGRCSEVARDRMPTGASVEDGWKHVDRGFYRGEELPPVSFYKVGASTSSWTATTEYLLLAANVLSG